MTRRAAAGLALAMAAVCAMGALVLEGDGDDRPGSSARASPRARAGRLDAGWPGDSTTASSLEVAPVVSAAAAVVGTAAPGVSPAATRGAAFASGTSRMDLTGRLELADTGGPSTPRPGRVKATWSRLRTVHVGREELVPVAADGTFALTIELDIERGVWPDNGEVAGLELQAEATPGWWCPSVLVPLEPETTRTCVLHALRAPGVVRGVAVGPDGRPGAAVDVALLGAVQRRQSTDASGRFQFEGLPPDLYLLQATRGGVELASRNVAVRGEEDVVLELEPTRTLRVTLLGPDDRARSGAVWCRSGEATRMARTAGGSARLEVPAGTVELLALSDDRPPLAARVTLEAAEGTGERAVDLQLSPAGRIEGRVITPSDPGDVEATGGPTAVGAVSAWAEADGRADLLVGLAAWGPDGRFALAVPPGRYEVLALRSNTALARRPVEVESGAVAWVDLASSGAVLQVRASGAPDGCDVVASVDGDQVPGYLGPDGTALLRDLLPGPCHVSLSRDGRVVGEAEVVIRAGARCDVEVRALAEADARVRVVDARGRGLWAVPVVLRGPLLRPVRGLTDETGLVDLRLVEGTWTAEVPADAQERLALQRGVRVVRVASVEVQVEAGRDVALELRAVDVGGAP